MVSARKEEVTRIQNKPAVAYIFPGQGSQFVGMGQDLYKASSGAKQIFDIVDDCLGFSLSSVMFQGPASDLAMTVNSQPAIMATSLAALAAFQELVPENRLIPLALAGHSLGEYSSLVAGGVVDLVDGIELVKERGRLMQEASDVRDGGMAAIIGLDESTVEKLCVEALIKYIPLEY